MTTAETVEERIDRIAADAPPLSSRQFDVITTALSPGQDSIPAAA